jgi:hypothetical protein
VEQYELSVEIIGEEGVHGREVLLRFRACRMPDLASDA